jgi:solute:Na+ symporter, SSS family
MEWIDWIMLAASVLLIAAIAVYTRRYIHSVADFMAGGRAAGRYLICNAKGEAGSGVANTLSKFQPILVSGFILSWWDISVPVSMIFAMFGFVVYRYRETRAMTLGQFFEMRYSRNFRLFAGMLGFLAGILNYGIFPAVSSQFFVYFLDLPQSVHILHLAVPTRILIMAGYLSIAMWMMTVGGQITLMVTHCVEGILSHLILVVVAAAIFCTISWAQMRTMLTATAPGHSLVNPFDQGKTHDFNFWFALMTVTMTIYGTMTAQKDNGFSSAARSAHEARMGGLLGWWRYMSRSAALVVIALGAMTLLKQPNFAGLTALHAISDPQLQSQMSVPIALRYLLPAGVKGMFLTLMVLGLISGDSSHMLTWGGIFIQDIVLPLRTTPMSPRQHVLVLRLALAGVALFAFLFSIFFHQTQYIVMWWAITEGIFACGAGIVIIGGLYWAKGTTAAAWSAFITGSVLSLSGIIGPYFGLNLPVNGKQVQFGAAAIAVLTYFVISLFTYRQDFDLDRMLHRGQYTDAPDRAPLPGRRGLLRRLGIDNDFTRADRIVAVSIFTWTTFWLAVTLVGTAWNLIHPWTVQFWTSYWLVVGIILPMLICIITLFWFGIGGILDIRSFFRILSSAKRDVTDDGTVSRPQESAFPVAPVKSR